MRACIYVCSSGLWEVWLNVLVVMAIYRRIMISLQVDGLSLLSAILGHWLVLGTKCPKTLISTHFHSLIRQHLLPESPVVKYQVRGFCLQLLTNKLGSGIYCLRRSLLRDWQI